MLRYLKKLIRKTSLYIGLCNVGNNYQGEQLCHYPIALTWAAVLFLFDARKLSCTWMKSEGFWRWCVIICKSGCLDFVHRLYFDTITTFRKLNLLPPSGKIGRTETLAVGSPGFASLRPGPGLLYVVPVRCLPNYWHYLLALFLCSRETKEWS
jgi:hypothetical protein